VIPLEKYIFYYENEKDDGKGFRITSSIPNLSDISGRF